MKIFDIAKISEKREREKESFQFHIKTDRHSTTPNLTAIAELNVKAKTW